MKPIAKPGTPSQPINKTISITNIPSFQKNARYVKTNIANIPQTSALVPPEKPDLGIALFPLFFLLSPFQFVSFFLFKRSTL